MTVKNNISFYLFKNSNKVIKYKNMNITLLLYYLIEFIVLLAVF